MNALDISIGRFRAAILSTLGHAPDAIEPGRLQRFATSDRRGDLAGWCRLFEDGRGGVFGDWRAGCCEVWTASARGGMTRAERLDLARQIEAASIARDRAKVQHWGENSQRIARLWAQCVPLEPGDPVTLYLKRRGFGGVWPLPGALRLHRRLPYWDGDRCIGTFPAMVAQLTAPDGCVVALHRTYLCADGSRAPVSSVKKLTRTAGPLAGACIALHRPHAGVLGVAEGIETAFGAWRASGVPTVAAYSAGNVEAFQWPREVRRLIVFADPEERGHEAARRLRQRAFAAGLRCEVLTPRTAGADWCDVWAAREDERLDAIDAELTASFEPAHRQGAAA